jgi:serine/threonine-protein kinase RsbW
MPESVSSTDLEFEQKPEHAVLLTIPARPDYITLARLALAGLGSEGRLQEETVSDLKVAVSEACALLLRFVDDEPHQATIRIVFEMAGDRWRVQVSGDAITLPPIEELEDPASETGLGVTIIRALVDELEVAIDEDGVGLLRLVKLVR